LAEPANLETTMNRREFVWGGAAGAAAMTVLGTDAVQAAADPTMSLNVIYPNQEGATFDLAYYRTSHIPLVMRVMKATKVILIEGVPTGTTPAPFAMIAHFQFPSAEALNAAVADPAMADVRADVAKFTNIKPTVMFGRTS
jgi:uncharacterized protein (TIGR02118 family)